MYWRELLSDFFMKGHQSMPTLDNLYALSDLLKVPMDMLVYGNRRYDPNKNIPEGAERLFRYYRLIQECMAA